MDTPLFLEAYLGLCTADLESLNQATHKVKRQREVLGADTTAGVHKEDKVSWLLAAILSRDTIDWYMHHICRYRVFRKNCFSKNFPNFTIPPFRQHWAAVGCTENILITDQYVYKCIHLPEVEVVVVVNRLILLRSSINWSILPKPVPNSHEPCDRQRTDSEIFLIQCQYEL